MAERRRRIARDPLGLRRALSDRLLPGLVAAMALLAALALAGARGADRLADRWQAGAAAAVTVQVPDPTRSRMELALEMLRADSVVARATEVSPERVGELLRPWLGDAPSLILPGVIELRLAAAPEALPRLAERLAEAVPGAELESHGLWVARLSALARSVQGVALAVLALVMGVAVAVVAVATHAGLAARREAIGVLHDLGATDRAIAGRFARRVGLLAGLGALGGAALAVPTLAALSGLAMPLFGGEAPAAGLLAQLPWAMLAALPPVAALIGWGTAQATVRRWLRRLP
ncbi:cell division transport system permease protein [Roseomonas rosea]|uniref:Cell division transport system permease protein n=1 Tax=Muricoccus roseus TaxID=198092 RepID=A0A1M6FXA0_9PROT|nr:FtsX-like permease family protein [Roseomonas rosea]SHJ02250.1 cell division transport system permease protein [Roseomonas rosea]